MAKAERRQALLRAARLVFARKGYHDAKVEDIAAEAGVAKGTFYLYFADKRSVFSELVDGLFSRIGAAIGVVDPAGDVEAQVRRNIAAIFAVLLDEPALTQLLLSYAGGLDPAFVAKVRSFHDQAHAQLSRSLEEGQRLGLVAPGDPQLYATFTMGAFKEVLFESAALGRARPQDEIAAELFRLLRGGYLRAAPGMRDALAGRKPRGGGLEAPSLSPGEG